MIQEEELENLRQRRGGQVDEGAKGSFPHGLSRSRSLSWCVSLEEAEDEERVVARREGETSGHGGEESDTPTNQDGETDVTDVTLSCHTSPGMSPDVQCDLQLLLPHTPGSALTRRWSQCHSTSPTGSPQRVLSDPSILNSPLKSWLRGRSNSLGSFFIGDADHSPLNETPPPVPETKDALRQLQRLNSVPNVDTQQPFPDASPNTPRRPPKLLLKTRSLEQILAKGNKYLQRARPILSRVTRLKKAASEKDLNTLGKEPLKVCKVTTPHTPQHPATPPSTPSRAAATTGDQEGSCRD